MKIVKVMIRRGDPAAGQRQMLYPTRYNAKEVDAKGRILPAGYSGHIGLGGDTEWLFIALDDETADDYALDPDMEIVAPEDADADLESWRVMRGEPAEQVTDAVRIQAIAAKQAAGIPLTDEDRDALDPDKPVRGINRRPSATEMVGRATAARADIEARRGGR